MRSLSLVASAVALAEGGSLKLGWQDCGGGSTPGTVSGLTPDSIALGAKTTVTGSGTLTGSAVPGGTFEIDLKASIISQKFTGDLCSAKSFPLPLGTGTIAWDGIKCPVNPGAVDIPVDVTLSASLPAPLQNVQLTISGADASAKKLLCMQINTSPAMMDGERDFTGYTYTDYLIEFPKNYNVAEQAEREAIFNANLEKIREHNSNPSKSYFLNVNEFADWTNEEFRAKRMGHRPELDQREFVGEFEATNIQDLPDSVDWREKSGVVTPVKDQGGCGSCWAFSTVETLESHLAIATGEAAPKLSPQQIVSCSPNPDDCGGTGGCQGSIQTLGFNYTETAGITTESSYPYRGTTGTCQQSKIKPVAKNDGYIKLKVNDYASLVSAVATKGPVAISLAAGSFGWQLYGGGVLTSCDCDMDHAVQLVGYGTDNSKDYWLVRNSWGGGWGEKGYIRIQRFGNGKEPTCTDKTPQDGEACKGDTKPRTYAGLCGIMGSSSIPTGMKKVGSEIVV